MAPCTNSALPTAGFLSIAVLAASGLPHSARQCLLPDCVATARGNRCEGADPPDPDLLPDTVDASGANSLATYCMNWLTLSRSAASTNKCACLQVTQLSSRHTSYFPRCSQLFSIGISIARELQQKLPVVTAMGNVKNATVVPAAPNPVRHCHGRKVSMRLLAYSQKIRVKIACKLRKRPPKSPNLLTTRHLPGRQSKRQESLTREVQSSHCPQALICVE